MTKQTPVEFYSEDQVLSVLQTAIDRHGSATAMAAKTGLEPSTVHRTLARRNPPRGPLLARCGFVAVVGYARKGVDEFVPLAKVKATLLSKVRGRGAAAELSRKLGLTKTAVNRCVNDALHPPRGLVLDAAGYVMTIRYARVKDVPRLRGFEIVDETKKRPDVFEGQPKRHKSMHQHVAAE